MTNLKVQIHSSSVKVLWVDTSYIWRLELSTWQKIAKLVLEEKIIVVDTGQEAEMIERFAGGLPINDSSKKKLKLYRTIVGEFFSSDHSSFLARQIKIAMKAYIDNEKEISFDFLGLFDPILKDLQPFLNDLNEFHGDNWGTARAFKKISSDVVDDWKKIRIDARRKKETFALRHTKELLGMYGAIKSTSEDLNTIRKKNLVASYLKKWNRITGNNDLEAMLRFFESNYFFQIPYVNIHSKLISDLIVGVEEPRDSDYFDIIMIAMILPFADYIVLT